MGLAASLNSPVFLSPTNPEDEGEIPPFPGPPGLLLGPAQWRAIAPANAGVDVLDMSYSGPLEAIFASPGFSDLSATPMANGHASNPAIMGRSLARSQQRIL